MFFDSKSDIFKKLEKKGKIYSFLQKHHGLFSSHCLKRAEVGHFKNAVY